MDVKVGRFIGIVPRNHTGAFQRAHTNYILTANLDASKSWRLKKAVLWVEKTNTELSYFNTPIKRKEALDEEQKQYWTIS